MKELSDQEIKKKLTQILLDFDELCKKHDLKYSLSHGTLLGAVRHKGFIPWDDDIDVLMDRDDYNNLINIIEEKKLFLSTNKYMFTLYKYDNSSYPFLKMVDTDIEVQSDFCSEDNGTYGLIFFR